MRKHQGREIIEPLLQKEGYQLTEHQWALLERYYLLLCEENEKYNLTAITEETQVYTKHFYDSATLLFMEHLPSKTVLDIGSGAGFPGIVLKIIEPTLQLTIIDALEKRTQFLKMVIKELELTDVLVYHMRAEDAPTTMRASYDYVVSRAVARLPILMELCAAFVKEEGYFIALKGLQAHEEKKEAEHAAAELGLTFDFSQQILLPNEEGVRYNLKYFKNRETPMKYPRNFGAIKKKPLE